MMTPRIAACLALLALASLLPAQTAPTAYTIVQTVAFPPAGSTETIYRSGGKALIEVSRPAADGQPASRSLSLYDLALGKSWSWNPGDASVGCNIGSFSGDWGDPYAMTPDLMKTIASGDLKPAGTEIVGGVATKIYDGVSNKTHIKAWLDEKDGLVVRAMMGAPGSSDLQPLINITRVSLSPPAASLFALPAACASLKLPPTPAELMAEETGDSGDNFVSANYGPGSKNSCSILVRVVAAKSMAPLNRKYQAAIDTTYDQNAPTPPHYEFGVGNDGTSTYAGGGLREITSQVRNGMLRIDNPPAYFMFGVNIPTPNHGADVGLIYRQCFAPVTMLYYVVKDPGNPGDGGDWLYAKSGKYAAVPAR